MLGLSTDEVDALVATCAIEAWDGAHGSKHILRESVQALCESGSSPKAGRSPSRAPLRVYVVDADRSVLSHYRNSLGQISTRVLPVFFETIFHALLAVGRHPPDVFILDLWTPAVDWFPMIHALCDTPELHGLKIAVGTHLSENLIASRGGLPHGVEHFQKPISATELEVLMSARAGRS